MNDLEIKNKIEEALEHILQLSFNKKESKYGVFYKSKLVNLNGGVAVYKSYNLARANIISLFSYEDSKEGFSKVIDKLIEDKIIEIREVI